ncbi:MAG: hypothetical protein Q8O46_04345 [bacterium]|nr:hypothetical protein [bacterium]
MIKKKQLRHKKTSNYFTGNFGIISIIVILLSILVISFYFSGAEAVVKESNHEKIEINIPNLNMSVEVSVPLIAAEPTNPKPTYTPTLKPMGCYNKNSDLWYPCTPSDYITPNNEWVRYYASQLFIDRDGWIKYKNEKIVSLVDTDGTPLLYGYKSFTNNYVYDWEQFGTGSKGSLANDDYWGNADYYLTHGMKGDCDEWSNTITSIMLSGEMSVWQNNKMVKQIIPAKAVMGYVGGIRDVWTEYQIYNTSWITSTSRKKDGYGIEYSATIFIEKDNQFNPIFEYTDNYFRRVQ